MPQFFIFLLKINIVLILFAAAYYLILRRLTFYTLNRIFLAFGILFATIYPFINLTEFFFRQKKINPNVAALVPEINQKVTEWVPSDFIIANWQIISVLFYVGVIVMAARLAMQFISLYILHSKSLPGAIGNYPVRILGEPVSPFSFWQTVYINPSLHQENELQTILEHEKIHVKQWHSLDIILAELSVVFYWFNPGVWMMKKAVKENLEFITDQKILNKGIDRKAYQYSLLDVGNLTASVTIVNNFNLSDLKKRIKMMNLKRSSPISLGRYLLVTPLLMVTTLAFTVSKKEIKKHLLPLEQVLVDNHVIPATESVKVTNIKITNKSTKAQPSVSVKNYTIAKKTYRFQTTLVMKRDSILNSDDHFAAVGEEVPTHLAVKRAKGTDIEPLQILKGDRIGEQQPELTIVRTKSVMNETVSDNVDRTITIVGYKMPKSSDTDQSKRMILKEQNFVADSAKLKSVSFFVDGNKVTLGDFKKIDTDKIQSINVVKKSGIGEIHIIAKKRD